jgi:hypothetical protein
MPSRLSKTSAALLFVSILYGSSIVYLMYSELTPFFQRIIQETAVNTEYTIAFFLMPVIATFFSAAALLNSWLMGAAVAGRAFVILGLLVSSSVSIWWFTSQKGVLPAAMFPVIFLFVWIVERARSGNTATSNRIRQ